jgi:ABC-2 type transport system ATP-binding protein
MKHPAINIKNITKKIGKIELLHDISLSIEKWEAFGFLGPNGAGKTTTMKCILGIMRTTSGEVKILGWDIDNADIRNKIGFMPENTYLYKYLTGDEFLDFNGAFYHLSREKLDERKNEVLEKVWLTHARSKRLHTYSKGMLQRIGLAQAILHDPEVIFLDEPMSGLDPVGRKMVKDLMLELKSQGKTLFFNTHILSDVEAICDRFAIIAKGCIVADMLVKDLKVDIEDFFMECIIEAHGDNMRVE